MAEETNNQSENSEQRELTPEEIKERRAKVIQYYKEQNEVLELQSTFEKHKADIAESIAREAMWQIRYAQMMAGPPETPNTPETPAQEDQGQKKRTLKKED